MKIRVNFEISARRVLLIDEGGIRIGIFELKDAVDKASAEGLDVVQVSQDQEIPICKMLDCGRLMYKIKKNSKNSKSTKIVIKEIKFGPNTAIGDINTKVKAANAFLEKGNHVKFTVKMNGRANAHKDIVIEKIETVLCMVNGKVESPPTFTGNICTAVVVPN